MAQAGLEFIRSNVSITSIITGALAAAWRKRDDIPVIPFASLQIVQRGCFASGLLQRPLPSP